MPVFAWVNELMMSLFARRAAQSQFGTTWQTVRTAELPLRIEGRHDRKFSLWIGTTEGGSTGPVRYTGRPYRDSQNE